MLRKSSLVHHDAVNINALKVSMSGKNPKRPQCFAQALLAALCRKIKKQNAKYQMTNLA
jgi:hypothetical protein